MRAAYLLCPVLAVSFLFGCAQKENEDMSFDLIERGGQHTQTFEKTVTKTLGCSYLLFLPEDYGEERKAWPLMLFLHGAGERGNDLQLVKKHGPPKIAETEGDFPFIVVSPQCPKDQWWDEDLDVLVHLLDDIVAKYDVVALTMELTIRPIPAAIVEPRNSIITSRTGIISITAPPYFLSILFDLE